MHYITDRIEQCFRYDYDLSAKVAEIFSTHRELFQFAYQEENCIFTHAGIVYKWFVNSFKGDIEQNIAYQLNNPRPEQEVALYFCSKKRGGFDETGGIFWADIEELYKPLQGYTQVVGHNRVKEITEYTNNGGRIIFCDCLFNEGYLSIV
ncbi:MAG: hypothetical protein LUD15_15575 [Bacteroides sp.]|nr:hypothetical protein [Bacteroides sp.]